LLRKIALKASKRVTARVTSVVRRRQEIARPTVTKVSLRHFALHGLW
jgi:hypothetical protein